MNITIRPGCIEMKSIKSHRLPYAYCRSSVTPNDSQKRGLEIGTNYNGVYIQACVFCYNAVSLADIQKKKRR